MFKVCEQCGQYHWAQRSTKRFCSTRCRVAYNRGQEPDMLEYPELQNEKLAALLAEHNPYAFEELEAIKKTYGSNAVNWALNAMRYMIKYGSCK